MSVQWGTVGEWVGGVATAAGLLFAALEIRASREERSSEDLRRREDETARQEAMARAVGVDVRPRQEARSWFVDYTISNGGDYPITDVTLVVGDPGAQVMKPEDQRGSAIELVVGPVMAKQTIQEVTSVAFTRDPEYHEWLHLGALFFTDTWGRHWVRTSIGIEKRDLPPRMC